MNSTTIWIILGVVALVALYLYNRSRPAARGTYDDPNARSSGSIGGGTRANDDPNVTSRGSIGGRSTDTTKDETVKPAHDDPNFKSGGSFGT
ncbi:hypothetical protein BH10CHL1_BH10CHL1_11410 [soil metagenome]